MNKVFCDFPGTLTFFAGWHQEYMKKVSDECEMIINFEKYDGFGEKLLNTYNWFLNI
jgi:hypothetical protein